MSTLWNALMISLTCAFLSIIPITSAVCCLWSHVYPDSGHQRKRKLPRPSQQVEAALANQGQQHLLGAERARLPRRHAAFSERIGQEQSTPTSDDHEPVDALGDTRGSPVQPLFHRISTSPTPPTTPGPVPYPPTPPNTPVTETCLSTLASTPPTPPDLADSLTQHMLDHIAASHRHPDNYLTDDDLLAIDAKLQEIASQLGEYIWDD